LWNLNNRVVAGYLDSLMLDESAVFARVLSDEAAVMEALDFEALAGASSYTARDAPMEKDG